METKASTRKRPTRTTTAKPKATVSSIKPEKTARATPATATSPDLQERRRLISEAAYFRAEARGFVPGYENIDWLEAEREVELAGENG